MKINNVTTNFINNYTGNVKQKYSSVPECGIQTSIYSQKGLTLPFCGIFKGANMFEDNCVVLLRKMREGRCRKFTELDISDIVTSLRQEKNSQKIEKFLQDISFEAGGLNEVIKIDINREYVLKNLDSTIKTLNLKKYIL